MKGLPGKNLGMTQKFDDNGDMVPVTVIKCGPCTVVQKKTREKEGYGALQLGFEEVKKLQSMNRPRKGHFQKAGTPIFKYLSECRLEDDKLKVGDQVGAGVFEVGDFLNIRGTTKGRGFQGVMKRHGKSGGGASHGSCFHRAPGSIGMNSDPARVIKNMKLPGHMGTDLVTIKNLKLLDIDQENSLLFVKGSVPGHRNGLVKIALASGDLTLRLSKKQEAGDKKQEVVKEVNEEIKKEEKANG